MIRNLKYYRWDYSQKKILIIDNRSHSSVLLDKIGFMSLMRFGISCLDKMRTDQIKLDREKSLKLKARNQKTKERITVLKQKIARLKNGKQQKLFSQKNYVPAKELIHGENQPQKTL